jgi:hypothetical protein
MICQEAVVREVAIAEAEVAIADAEFAISDAECASVVDEAEWILYVARTVDAIANRVTTASGTRPRIPFEKEITPARMATFRTSRNDATEFRPQERPPPAQK